jgi:hypothetical protein
VSGIFGKRLEGTGREQSVQGQLEYLVENGVATQFTDESLKVVASREN